MIPGTGSSHAVWWQRHRFGSNPRPTELPRLLQWFVPKGRLKEAEDGRENAPGNARTKTYRLVVTENGARVGDLTFMSLIHTCQLNDVNPFHYLTGLHKHGRELAVAPADWMPWNYREKSRT